MAILDLLAVLLPFLLSLLGIHMAAELSKRAKIFLVICGIVVSGLIFMQQTMSRNAHEKEIAAQGKTIEDLKQTIQRNELQNIADMTYLKTKLGDYSSLGPALMKLAETSADFEKKQYENKVETDHDLYVQVVALVKKIRDFSKKYSDMEEQSIAAQMSTNWNALTPAQRQIKWSQSNQEIIRQYYDKEREFQLGILPDARYLREMLIQRKLPEPHLAPIDQATIRWVLQGNLAGPSPELTFATYLEQFAKPLSGR